MRSPWTWARPSGLLPGADPPSLLEEMRHWGLVIAEASLAIDEAQTHQERAKYGQYLRRATERFNEAAGRLAAFEKELECVRPIS